MRRRLAARLQALAMPGTVLICESTRAHSRQFGVPRRGLRNLKGCPSYPLGSTQNKRGGKPLEAQHKTKLTPPIGRDEEIDLLLRRWRNAMGGEGSAVVLTGEPGIGKSHIALALEDRLKESGQHIALHFFCSAHHTSSALYPFIRQLERAAGFERADSPDTKFAKLEALLVQSGGTAEKIVPPLANLLLLPAGSRHQLPELSPQNARRSRLRRS